MHGFLWGATVVAIIAKLAGLIAWSWWLVAAPALVSLGLSIVVIAAVFFGALVASFTSWR